MKNVKSLFEQKPILLWGTKPEVVESICLAGAVAGLIRKRCRCKDRKLLICPSLKPEKGM